LTTARLFIFNIIGTLFYRTAATRSSRVKDHILLAFAGELEIADAESSAKITTEVLREIVELIPDEWLGDKGEALSAIAERRAVYFEFTTRRLDAPRAFLQEAIDARKLLV
jgi:hypothetical protein